MKYAATIKQLGAHFGVSRQTATDWLLRPGAPQASSDGYDLAAWDAYLRASALGPYRKNRTASIVVGQNGHSRSYTLVEALTFATMESGERHRIAKERAQITQLVELGVLVLANDIEERFLQAAATIIAAVDGIAEAVERSLPSTVSDAERDAIMTAVAAATGRVSAAVVPRQ